MVGDGLLVEVVVVGPVLEQGDWNWIVSWFALETGIDDLVDEILVVSVVRANRAAWSAAESIPGWTCCGIYRPSVSVCTSFWMLPDSG